MLTINKNKLVYLLGIVCICFSFSPCVAAERWQVVILPDASYQSPIELSELHNIISQQLTLALSAADFDVHSPLHLGLPNCIVEDCSGLTDQRIRHQATASGKNINLALLYQITITKQAGRSIDNWNFKLSGRLLDLENGTEQDAFTLDSSMNNVGKNCLGQCFKDSLEQHAGLLAQELGAILSEKLASLSRRFTYQLALHSFTPDELQKINHYLKNVDTYIADTLLREFAAKAQWLHQVSSREYRYVSEMSSSELGNQLQSFLSEEGISAKLRYENNPLYENEQRLFTLTRVGTPYLAAYFVAIITLILLPLLIFLIFKKPRQMQYLANIAKAREYVDQAKSLIRQHDYVAAETQLAAALVAVSDNAAIVELQQRIAVYKSAYERFQLGQAEIPHDPAKALNYLRQAKQLNPLLTELTLPLEQQCLESLDELPESTSSVEFANSAYKVDDFTSHSSPLQDNSQYSTKRDIPDPNRDQGLWLFSTVSLLVIMFSVLSLGAYWHYESKQVQAISNNLHTDEQALVQTPETRETPIERETEEQKRLELSAWYQAKELNSIQSYQQYLNQWPQGQYTVYVKQLLSFKTEDRNAWQSAQNDHSIVSYQHYIDVKPMGKFAEQAQEKLTNLIEQQRKVRELQRLMDVADESYFKQKDYEQALYYYQQAAEQGVSQAQYQLASMYKEGLGVKQENRQAAQWYKLAAEQGHKQAQASLGYMYSKGLGLEQSDAQALSWYLKAAKQSVMTAQYNLAYMYDKAQGIRQNYPQAAFWYEKAAEQGDADAQNNLGKLYENGLGVIKDMSKAKALYRRAARQDHQAAKINLLMLRK
jgi:TPR repeat protein